jgi:predicted MFS family arabinose efflux permease
MPSSRSLAFSLPRSLVTTFAIACGLTVGNIYYAQPLLATLADAFGTSEASAALIVTITQVGYAVGLLILVPLGDLVENRRLVVTISAGTVLALLVASAAPSLAVFFVASLGIGVTSVVAQVLVPFAAHLAPPETRGRVIGQVMSGLLLGILLARAMAGILAGVLGWRAVYLISAILLAAMILVLRRMLPIHKPTFAEGYGVLVASLAKIYRKEPLLRRRAAYQAIMFGSFSAFWTSVTFLLSGPQFHLSQAGIGVFSLAGAIGALFAPVAGHLGDAGFERPATGMAFLISAGGFALTLVPTKLWALVVGAILIDLGTQATLVLGQQVIYGLNPAERSRLNTLYIATFFVGGAIGSGVAGIAYAYAGWPAVVAFGAALPIAGFVFWLSDRRKNVSALTV